MVLILHAELVLDKPNLVFANQIVIMFLDP